ncbi:MAG TPA: histidine kinase dimerization/phospho-acceptor domain-containing protein, partial [Ktedonobacteraceae bacterium]
MEKHSSQSDEHGRRKQEGKPARKHASRKNTEQETMPCSQLQGLFQSFPDSIVICDLEDKILQFNAATLTLFEVSDEAVYRGTSFQQFLHTFQQDDLHLLDSAEYVHMGVVTAPHPIEKSLLLHLPSGHEVAAHLWYAPLFDEEKHVAGTAAIFMQVTPPYQKDLHLQQVHEAIVALNMAIASLPVYDAQALPEEPLLLSPQVSVVAQPLVDLIDQVLNSRRVLLFAMGSAGQLSSIASSGLTAEQEQALRASKDMVASMFFDEQVLARLSAHREVLLASQDLRKRPLYAPAFGSENLLVLPLFLEEQLAGVLIIVKPGVSAGYTPKETELAKILILEIELLVECLDILHERIESGTRALAQQEVGRLSNDFLALASHDLRTPLTGIMGNIQLAQRRLTRLKRQIREQAREVNKSFEQLEEPLASAVE